MDPVRNPFVPSAGAPPPELAGRQPLIETIEIALDRTAQNRHAPGTILVGLRGVGKTVLLRQARSLAEERSFLTAQIEVHEGKRLVDLIVPTLRSMLYKLSRYEAAKEQTRRGLRVLKSFISVVKISVGEMEMSIEPELGTADSGDLELDLPDLFGAVGEAARAAIRPICLVVDELQYLSETEFSALIMAMHRVAQDQAPVYFIGAGLPQIRMLAGNSKSYSERLFRFPDIGPLAAEDAMDALQRPAEQEGARFADDAAAEILRITQGYPYFLQQWGYETWNYAAAELFTLDDVKAASRNAIEELDRSFFRVRFERCTDAEKRYMRALAALGDGSHRSGDVADLLGVKVTSAAPRRNILIKKGMIYSRAHGEIAFSVPLFHEFMEREMPDWPEKG